MNKTEKLIDLDKRHHLHPSSPVKDNFNQGPMVLLERGEGIYLYDVDGKRYIDGLASLWNVNIGHGRKEIAEVAKAQMEKLAFSHSFNRFSHESAVLLAEKIASLAPGDLNAVQFTSGGSESNDTAFKLVRHYFKLKGEPDRFKIIARYRAYHGISMGATSATGIPIFRQMGGPLASGFIHAAAPHCYRCESCQSDCSGACAVQSIKDLIEKEDPKTIAAIILEPIQGAGGVIVPPPGYIKQVREICDQHGILMIADEVITGFGRTGRWFGMEHEGVAPDLMTFAKGVTSGYIPLGGVVISERIHQEIIELSNQNQVLPHGYTYSAHPTACSVALRNLDIISDEKLVENAEAMGQVLKQGLAELAKEFEIVGNVMSRGLIASLEFVQDRATKKAFPATVRMANQVFDKAMSKGLITRAITIDNTDIVALCPPLIITREQIGEILEILRETLKEVEASL